MPSVTTAGNTILAVPSSIVWLSLNIVAVAKRSPICPYKGALCGYVIGTDPEVSTGHQAWI